MKVLIEAKRKEIDAEKKKAKQVSSEVLAALQNQKDKLGLSDDSESENHDSVREADEADDDDDGAGDFQTPMPKRRRTVPNKVALTIDS